MTGKTFASLVALLLISLPPTAYRVDASVADNAVDSIEDDLCTYCQEAVNFAKLVFGSPEGIGAAKGLLRSVCASTGPLAALCDEFVDVELDRFVKFLNKTDTNGICAFFHLCKSTDNEGRPVCDACREVASTTLSALRATPTTSNLHVNICDFLGRRDLLCHHRVGVLLASTKAVGSDALFCASSCDEAVNRRFLNSVRETLATTSRSTSASSLCQTCVDVINSLIPLVTTVVDVAEKNVNELCDLIKPLSEVCHSVVKPIFSEIENAVEGIQANDFCQKLHICKTTSLVALAGCDFCEEAVTQAKALIGTPQAESDIKSLLLEMCGKLGPLEKECKSYLLEKFNEMMEDIEHLDPHEFCEMWGLCNAKLKEVPTTTSSVPDGVISSKTNRKTMSEAIHRDSKIRIESGLDEAKTDLQLPVMSCETCKFVVATAKDIFNIDDFQSELVSLIEDVCNDFSPNIAAQCKDFLSLYAKHYLKLGIAEIDPKAVCSWFGACDSKAGVISPFLTPRPLTCLACRRGIAQFAVSWRDVGMRAKALNTLQSACLRAPDDAAVQRCVDQVDVMFPRVSKLVEGAADGAVCLTIGACDDETLNTSYPEILD